MINSFKNTAHILLAVFLLLSSVGISVNKMICLSGGKSSISFLGKKSCCPGDEKSPDSETLNARCCDFVSGYVQVDLLSVENPIKIKSPQFFDVASFLNQFQVTLLNFPIPQFTSETPPLLHGVSLLKFINIFRI